MMIAREELVSQKAERRWLVAPLLLYGAALAYMIPRHEPWADEAQAWQLARYLPLHSLFGTYIHYEASPGLWHALLWLLARCSVSYTGMHWVVGLIAAVGVWLFLTRSPFPLYLRMMLPFTYFFVYQYAIVARSYVLFAPVLAALAIAWKRRWTRPAPTAFFLGLLANISLHGLAIAAGLMAVLAIEWLQGPRSAFSGWRLQLASLGLLLLMLGFAGWCVLPKQNTGWVYSAHNVLKEDSSYSRASDLSRHYSWSAKLPVWLRLWLAEAVDILKSYRHGLADKWQLGLLAWLALLLDCLHAGLLRYLIPSFLLAVVSPPFPYHLYHAGVMWVLLLFLAWATWDEGKRSLAPRFAWQRVALVLAITLCAVMQLDWALRAFQFDARNAYSPNRDGAIVLERYLAAGHKVDVAVPTKTGNQGMLGEFFVVGLEPYFSREPVSNMPFRFWFWGENQGMRLPYLADIHKKAAVVLVEEAFEDDRYKSEEAQLISLGYTRNEVVCGQLFYPDDISPALCHAFYRPPTYK